MLPYYAEKALEELNNLKFEEEIRRLNPTLELGRSWLLKIWITVVTTEYWFEDEKEIQAAIQQACVVSSSSFHTPWRTNLLF